MPESMPDSKSLIFINLSLIGHAGHAIDVTMRERKRLKRNKYIELMVKEGMPSMPDRITNS